MNITLHIQKLVAQYDHVIIPGFGGFVTNYEPAQVHRVQQIITPPSKSVAFNKNLISNDGLLVNFISQQENISIKNAQDTIKAFIEKCYASLKNKEVVMLPGLGKLFMDLDGNLQFVQDKNFNHLLQSYGLPEVAGRTVIRKQIIDTNLGMRNEDDAVQKVPGKNRLWYYAAAGFLLLVLGLGSFAFLDEDANKLTCSLLGISTQEKITTPPPPPVTRALSAHDHILGFHFLERIENEEVLEEEISEETATTENRPAAPSTATPTITSPSPVTTKITNGAIPKGYFVVIGSFTRDKNVSRLYQKLHENDQQSYKIPGEAGFTRIGIYIPGDLGEVQKKLDSLRNVYNEQAWILKND